jgi:hypothetical protein
MEWMSPIDSSFLHVENDATPMHIGAVSIFAGPPPPFDDLRTMVAGKLGLVPRYRQKVCFVPLAAGSPAWVDDPRFSLSYHLRHTAVPAPGSSLTGQIGPHRRWSWAHALGLRSAAAAGAGPPGDALTSLEHAHGDDQRARSSAARADARQASSAAWTSY